MAKAASVGRVTSVSFGMKAQRFLRCRRMALRTSGCGTLFDAAGVSLCFFELSCVHDPKTSR